MENIKQKLKQNGGELRKEVGDRILGYIVAAFGLVAGLAWNDAIKSLIEYFFPLSKNTVWAKLSYAVIITVVATVVTIYLFRILKKDSENPN